MEGEVCLPFAFCWLLQVDGHQRRREALTNIDRE
jgi:hypothetical protein